MSTTSVSICIPTYNGAAYLEACLHSACRQTYSDIEIFVLDDGSSDNSVSIALRMAKTDSRIRVEVNKRNLGLVGNWNRCVEQTKSPWIKFLFQDDLLHPECVALLMAEARGQGKRLAVCDRDFIFEGVIDTRLQTIYARSRAIVQDFLAPQRGATAEAFALRILNRLNNNYVGEPTAALMHRSVFDEYGLFNAEMAQLCDLEYWMRIASHEGLAFVPQTLASFRVHASATSAINRSSRNFRSSGLDSLALRDLALEQPVYANLRSIWGRTDSLQQMRHERWGLANGVVKHLNRHRPDQKVHAEMLVEYQAFLLRHPACRVSGMQHLAWRLKSMPSDIKYRFLQWLNPKLPKNWQRDLVRPL